MNVNLGEIMAEKNRKNDIILEAFNLLREEGLPHLSYDLIAKRSGVSRQLIRYYFASKEDFMVAMCDHLALAYRQALVQVAHLTEAPERLDTLLDYYFDLLDDNRKPQDDPVYDAMFCLAAGSDKIRKNLQGQYSLLGAVVSHEITFNHPEMNVQDANQLAYLFVCLMYGHWKMVATLGFSEQHNIVTRNAIGRLIASYVDKPSDVEDRPNIWSD